MLNPLKSEDLKSTVLSELHYRLNAQMVPFAEYEMPLKYETSVITEHLHTRSSAGLFDVAHMGQADLIGTDPIRLFEKIVPASLKELKQGQIKYTQILNASGGIIDDLMVTRCDNGSNNNSLRIVVNAACKDKDFDFIRSQLIGDLKLLPRVDLSLISLQGPKAYLVLCKLFPQIINMPFMTSKDFFWNNKNISISRCGYTGEDGFEISLANEITLSLVEELLSFEEVLPIGLAARDTLRLEAGLCLYGNDIDETITPVQADLGWSIGKRRIKEKNFLGSKKLISEINNSSIKKRVGLKILDKSIARKGMIIKSVDGLEVGKITSGAFGPSVGYPIALGYVLNEFSNSETNLLVSIRNKNVEVKVVQLPFIKHRYYKGVIK